MLSADKPVNELFWRTIRTLVRSFINTFLTSTIAFVSFSFIYFDASDVYTDPPPLIYLFLAPVVVVSEQHTNAGPYPVTVQHQHTNMTAQPYPMMMQQQQQQPGMPMPGNYGPYAGQPGQAPYPTNAAPYPMAMPQPAVMPMPQNPAMMNPPSYNEVVGSEAYQKQAPYNPNFSS